jgi:CRISPR-associated protein (TIGR03986 family)
MAEGTIKWFNHQKGYGFIEREGEEDLFIHINQWRGSAHSIPEEGERVAFVEGKGPKGRPEAQNVRPVGEKPAKEDQKVQQRTEEKDYRFLNPYNFVRYLERPRPKNHVLGDCPPPPHDRYVGLTGRITCEVEAVTPLFISDSHAVQGEQGEHHTYRFFKLDGEPALPASSLRGMLRSVFEAATNSCFVVFDYDRQLEFRERPEYGNKVKNGAGIVNVLPGPGKEGEIVLCHIAKVGAYYEGKNQWKNALGRKPNGQLWRCGDQAVARAKPLQQGYVVRELSTAKDHLQPLGDGEEYVQGWLKITGKGEGTSKKSEILFLNPDKHGCPGVVPFGVDEMEEYNYVLAGQRERGDIHVSPQSSTLSVGDLVWVETEGEGKHRRAKRIVRVQVPRIPYKQTVGKLLSDHAEHLEHCKCYDTLCPACRVFGWVHENAADLPTKKRVAYAGRLRLSHGTLTNNAGTLPDTTLAILSTPKPTTTAFYLLDAQGQPNAAVDYDTAGARLRGRKFYRHQGEAKPEEYQRDDKSDQNRTVKGALRPGSTFTFTVDFENLAPLELGALLYALELENGMFHRLGYAKPLGFGSVKVTVESVQTIDWETRLHSIEPEAGWRSIDGAQHKQEFLKTTKTLYGDEFGKVLSDLRALLGAPPELPIHCPRPTRRFDPDHPQFEWFVGNKRRIEKRRDDAVSLPLASADTQGLPLIEKDGKEGRG